MPRRSSTSRLASARLQAKDALQDQFREYLCSVGCFNCSSEDPAVLQVAHLQRGKTFDPRKKICYIIKENRESTVNLRLEDLRECGILCRDCHQLFDGPWLYGHPKPAWSGSFSKHAVAHAQWVQWKREYLSLSDTLDLAIAEAIAD